MYKGYYYDEETKLYYCISRYNSPEFRRFISPDKCNYLEAEELNGLNLYCYCGNDPINYADPSGHIAFFVVTAIIGAVVGFGLAAYNDYRDDGVWFNGSVGSYIWYTLGGAAIGAIAGLGTSALLAGNFFASVGSVAKGTVLTYQMLKAGGFGATMLMLGDNLSSAFNNFTHVFWSGGDISMNGGNYLANDVGGKTLEMTRLGQYLTKHSAEYDAWKIASANFANQVSNGSTVFVMQNINGVGIASTWATTEYPILAKKVIEFIYEIIGGI